ncbi:hypothetical protein K458DRAFT_6801 [Lentithecium fluviatile CBS 122367]|uniref:Uncharacterized protein n=1 Tax=Lentithecium fluviatile CBS 122367 TaxID=1168545 RepID=A0A6G1JMW3_9PLEO|nr:hypothetical protein K458DRAFT_6801 [Lentithecium fluviatile CBS 122367]
MGATTEPAKGEVAAVETGPQTSLEKGMHPHDFIEHVLTRMADVEKEMNSLREYWAAHDKNDEPFFNWSPYARYAKLHQAAGSLDWAVGELDLISATVTLPPDLTKKYLYKARGLSLSTSKATIFAIQVMSKKTGEYVQGPEGSSLPSPASDISNHIVASEIGKLLEHSTEATEGVWAAVDLLQQLHNVDIEVAQDQVDVKLTKTKPNVESSEKALGKTRKQKDYLTLVCILLCLFLTTMQELRHPTIFVSRRASNNCANVYSLFGDSYKLIASIQQAQDEKLDALNKQSQDTELRVDNLWEALGPPNANGTYYGAKAEHVDTSSEDIDKKLQVLKEGLERQVKRVEANAAGFKKAMQLADIRLSSRLDKVERKAR